MLHQSASNPVANARPTEPIAAPLVAVHQLHQKTGRSAQARRGDDRARWDHTAEPINF